MKTNKRTLSTQQLRQLSLEAVCPNCGAEYMYDMSDLTTDDRLMTECASCGLPFVLVASAVTTVSTYRIESKDGMTAADRPESDVRFIGYKIDRARCAFIITDQTHRCDRLTPSGNRYQTSSGLTIKSVAVPDYDPPYLYVRGDGLESDLEPIKCDTDGELDKCIGAIDEYNAYFATKAIAEREPVAEEEPTTEEKPTINGARHIEYTVEGQYLVILDQSHREIKLTPTGATWTAPNGFQLASVGGPDYPGGDMLYLRGHNQVADSRPILISNSITMRRACEAIDAYNQEFAVPEEA